MMLDTKYMMYVQIDVQLLVLEYHILLNHLAKSYSLESEQKLETNRVPRISQPIFTKLCIPIEFDAFKVSV